MKEKEITAMWQIENNAIRIGVLERKINALERYLEIRDIITNKPYDNDKSYVTYEEFNKLK